MTKADLRKNVAARLAALGAEEAMVRSASIRRRALALPEVIRASTIFTYVSFAMEVDTLDLIRDLLGMGKRLAVPLVTGPGLMEAREIGGLEDLAPGRFGILAPRTDGSSRRLGDAPEVSICPGLAFTAEGKRLGRGKGFYDRFLAEHPETFAVGICYELQLVDTMPVSPKDRRVNVVVTEDRVLRP